MQLSTASLRPQAALNTPSVKFGAHSPDLGPAFWQEEGKRFEVRDGSYICNFATDTLKRMKDTLDDMGLPQDTVNLPETPAMRKIFDRMLLMAKYASLEVVKNLNEHIGNASTWTAPREVSLAIHDRLHKPQTPPTEGSPEAKV